MSIEQRFDISFVGELALREKQIQQNYRPVIGVHKWFARRPGTLFRALILAEFGDDRLDRTFFQSHDLSGLRIADPFMGGGTPLIEANRLGCDVYGFDINPMAAWIVSREIERIDVDAYQQAARSLIGELRPIIGAYYVTSCPLYGDPEVPVKSFLWVKVQDCVACGRSFDLFPGYLVAGNRRHPKHVLVCPSCGDLNEVEDRRSPGQCGLCGAPLREQGPARRGRCGCPHCGQENLYPGRTQQPLDHRLFAIEYHNPDRKAHHRGRFFKKPDAEDLARAAAAGRRFEDFTPCFVPDERIPEGDETDRLHRWGYARYRDMFNPRQLLGLELSCRLIAKVGNRTLRHALATNLSDLLRYQNMLCRYDVTALKALDIFSVHGFPVGLVQCESNFLGIAGRSGSNVGSGGWSNVVEKYVRAKRYCEAPFEVRRHGSQNTKVHVRGEWIGEQLNGRHRLVALHCRSSTKSRMAPDSLDAVFTDPPYFGNVQYGELMDFCYVWLRRLVGGDAEGFERTSTRSPDELTGNVTAQRGLEHFAEGLSKVYSRMAVALQAGGPLAFTFHHNKLEAYCAVAMAILDAGFVCTASLPCPAEMGGSIHIHGTKSSIIDTVFVCRIPRATTESRHENCSEQLMAIVRDDLAALAASGRRATLGDSRCIVFGHLTRLAVMKLRNNWNPFLPTAQKIADLSGTMGDFGDVEWIASQAATKAIDAESLGPLFDSPFSCQEA